MKVEPKKLKNIENPNQIEILTQQISSLHSQSLESFKVGISKAIEIGRLLVWAKEKIVPFGQFGDYCKTLPFSERTAQNYMKVYLNRKLAKTESLADLNSFYEFLKKSVSKAPEALLPTISQETNEDNQIIEDFEHSAEVNTPIQSTNANTKPEQIQKEQQTEETQSEELPNAEDNETLIKGTPEIEKQKVQHILDGVQNLKNALLSKPFDELDYDGENGARAKIFEALSSLQNDIWFYQMYGFDSNDLGEEYRTEIKILCNKYVQLINEKKDNEIITESQDQTSDPVNDTFPKEDNSQNANSTVKEG